MSNLTKNKNIIFYISTLQKEEIKKSNRKAMNRNWSNQKANFALKTKTGKQQISIILYATNCTWILLTVYLYHMIVMHS